MAKNILIEVPYLGNVSFYEVLQRYDHIFIEKHSFYQKASYRNRCEIAGVNGKLLLSVPLMGGKDKKQYYKDAQISYEHNWLKDHWNSLCSAYRRSPYFEFYEDKFEAVYFKKHKNLFNLNVELFQLVNTMLKWNVPVSFTEKFEKEIDYADDFREKFLPKKETISIIKYHQVFGEKNDFIPNTSIIDLLFNEGPNTLNILKTKHA